MAKVCGHGLLGLRFRIPPWAWMSVCLFWVLGLPGKCLCDGPITRPEITYGLYVIVCDQETLKMKRPWLELGSCGRKTKKSWYCGNCSGCISTGKGSTWNMFYKFDISHNCVNKDSNLEWYGITKRTIRKKVAGSILTSWKLNKQYRDMTACYLVQLSTFRRSFLPPVFSVIDTENSRPQSSKDILPNSST